MSEQEPPVGPPPIRPSNVLDAVLSDSGPMPAARYGIRTLALALDLVLVVALTALILKGTLLTEYPDAPAVWSDYNAAIQDVEYAKKMIFDMRDTNPELLEIATYALSTLVTVAWFYFAAGEAFFNGSSLGKRCCRLRSISTITLGQPSIFSGIVRGGLKTILLFSFGVIGWAAMLIPLAFNKRRQMGHDLLSRTAVVDEKYLKSQAPTST